ncbi:efflux RND transporter periplasmic adaptor subunit [Alteromonas oceanisediminis]|uniref:efflux RND transporter periplasmic adaptor subunit n=1 Tax=Alteromonas oceanisediminis TaxID=2836180 RepID=UPI001BDAAEFC|nr:efflux RND transporter periplasmic adaptor subunit [Alteromonas oceanisediminis]MBT0586397.1 efflux RND transporter periplasmic adaptor subunit [Alteromonas oceanisediminis]
MNNTIKKAGIPIVILIVAVIAMIGLISMKKPPEKKPVETEALLVSATPIAFEAVQFTVSTQGNVLPMNETTLTAQVSGRIDSIADVFVEGGFFKQGDVLLTLESEDYRTEVQLAEAEVARATANLQEEVARGRVAETEWRSVNSSVAPDLGLRKPQLAREQASLKAAQAQLEKAQRNLARTQIKAPYDGMVVSRDVDVGQFVSSATSLGMIYSTRIAEVRLPLTDADLAFVELDKGEPLPVNLTSVVAGQRKQWQASLVRTEGVLDQRSRVIYAVAQVADPYLRDENSTRAGDVLRFGQFVNATITGRKADRLVVLPRHTLRLDGTVLAVTPDNEIAIRQVDVVRADETSVYIRSGLEPTDKVATSAVPNPYSGMPVRLPGSQSDEPSPAERDVEDAADDEIAQVEASV